MSSENESYHSRNEFKDKLAIRGGAVHKLQLRPYDANNPAIPITAAVFAFDSSFPGPGIFLHLSLINDLARKSPEKMLMVFGHTDKVGKEVYNKGLSDRRAKAVLSLLTQDLELFDKIAKEEDWDLRAYQAMLRGIGCNPGAIDGVDGPMTQAAIRAFQTEYNEGFYHGSRSKLAIAEGIAVDGKLTSATKAAVRDAYLAVAPSKIPSSRFLQTPFAGCSEFNPISDKNELNRRAVVAFVGPDSPVAKEIPCRPGDISACWLDDKGKMRCKFYRRGIQEEKKEPEIPRFFDFQWLKEESGEAHLSALTYIPDGTPAKFSIYKCDKPLPMPPPNSTGGGTKPSFKKQLATVDGKISGGVCYARWKPPKDYDPFDYDCWLVDLDLDVEIFSDSDEEELKDDDPASVVSLFDNEAIEPPVFCIDAGGHWGFSSHPGKLLNRVRFVNEPKAAGIAIRSDGGILNFEARDGKVDVNDQTSIISLVLTERVRDAEEEQ